MKFVDDDDDDDDDARAVLGAVLPRACVDVRRRTQCEQDLSLGLLPVFYAAFREMCS